MRPLATTDRQPSSTLRHSWLDSIAKKAVLKMLERISIGHLTLEDQGQTYSFGQGQGEGELVAHIQVQHPSAYRLVLSNGTIGSGEAYMQGAWWSPDLVQVIRLMVANMAGIQRFKNSLSRVGLWLDNLGHYLNKNTKEGSKKNISAHYDLGNDFFSLFLDPTMLYSAAIYPDSQASLHQASIFKMEHICQRLNLSEGEHLLEIGTGWGAMACYAAETRGCKVTSVTISKEQYEHAQNLVKQKNLQDKVEIRLQDYRDLNGQFDKLVSIEMIEAVGYQFYSSFFSKCSQLLKPEGKMLIQAITIADQRFHQEKNNADFIRKYIFPGGCLPSIEVISQHLRSDTDMQLIGLEDITLHYAQTLADWKQAFFEKIDEVRAQGFDEVFIRMWDFYLSYCEGGFRERVIGTSQFLMAKPQCRDLPAIA